jgi:hypothetical protein
MREILRAKSGVPAARPGDTARSRQRGGAVSAWAGWFLAALAMAAGYAAYGWRGLVLGLTVVAFWLLLQFSRALRTLRRTAQGAQGHVANAVMLNARLHQGMRLPEILALTHSLGRALPTPDGDAFAWRDASGDEVQVELARGRVTAWRLLRSAPPEGRAQS